MSDMDEGGEGEMGDALDPSMMGEGGAGAGGLVLPGGLSRDQYYKTLLVVTERNLLDP